MQDITSLNTEPLYAEGYLDALSDVLGMLRSVEETPAIYKLKETIREVIERAEE